MNCNVHTLANGATVITMSPHVFRFSDGTEAPPQNKEFCDKFTLDKHFKVVRTIKGMKLTATEFKVTEEQYELLKEVSKKADIVLTSFQFLQALCDNFMPLPNVVAFNATKETSRLPPDQKIVDINNWSAIV